MKLTGQTQETVLLALYDYKKWFDNEQEDYETIGQINNAIKEVEELK
jgi:hypothetical protein